MSEGHENRRRSTTEVSSGGKVFICSDVREKSGSSLCVSMDFGLAGAPTPTVLEHIEDGQKEGKKKTENTVISYLFYDGTFRSVSTKPIRDCWLPILFHRILPDIVIVSHKKSSNGTVIGITQPLPKEGAWSALFSNLSKSGLDSYVVKCSKRPLLEEVAWPQLP